MATDEDGAPDDAAPYGAIPARAFADRKLGESDFRVIGLIASYDRRSLARGKGAGCFKSINRLAAEIGMNPRQFRRSVENAVRLGYIQRTPRGERWDGYVLRVIYGGEDSTVPTPLTEQSPPPVSTVPRVRTAESSGCGLPSAHIRENLTENTKETEESSSSFREQDQQSRHDDLVSKIAAHWSSVAVPAGAKPIRKVGPDRRELISQRIKSDGLTDILAAIDRIALAKWATEGEGWRVTLDWVLRPGNVNRILEGQCDDRKPTGGAGSIDGLVADIRNRAETRTGGDGFTRACNRWANLGGPEHGAPEEFFAAPEPHSDLIEAVFTEIDEGQQ